MYSHLREYLNGNQTDKNIVIFETGTARGFSSICMSKGLEDDNRNGLIISTDILPHNKAFYWNCIDDNEKKKTRKELLQPWKKELE